MPLQEFIAANQALSIHDLRKKSVFRPLVLDIQTKLTALGILDPYTTGSSSTTVPFKPLTKQDGLLGHESLVALRIFGDLVGSPITDTLHPQFALHLQQAQADTLFGPLDLDLEQEADDQLRLAKRLLRYMQQEGYWIARMPGMLNVVYVEGVDRQGLPNDDRTDDWNDRRIVITIVNGRPVISQNFDATTEPGWETVKNPGNNVNAV
ncbi:MAG: hypothetical protein ABIQ93_13645, partial [Saprospiraceae bacterium]